jgi:hypothetical protein
MAAVKHARGVKLLLKVGDGGARSNSPRCARSTPRARSRATRRPTSSTSPTAPIRRPGGRGPREGLDQLFGQRRRHPQHARRRNLQRLAAVADLEELPDHRRRGRSADGGVIFEGASTSPSSRSPATAAARWRLHLAALRRRHRRHDEHLAWAVGRARSRWTGAGRRRLFRFGMGELAQDPGGARRRAHRDRRAVHALARRARGVAHQRLPGVGSAVQRQAGRAASTSAFVFRQGLLGAAASMGDAEKLVREYIDERPLAENLAGCYRSAWPRSWGRRTNPGGVRGGGDRRTLPDGKLRFADYYGAGAVIGLSAREVDELLALGNRRGHGRGLGPGQRRRRRQRPAQPRRARRASREVRVRWPTAVSSIEPEEGQGAHRSLPLAAQKAMKDHAQDRGRRPGRGDEGQRAVRSGNEEHQHLRDSVHAYENPKRAVGFIVLADAKDAAGKFIGSNIEAGHRAAERRTRRRPASSSSRPGAPCARASAAASAAPPRPPPRKPGRASMADANALVLSVSADTSKALEGAGEAQQEAGRAERQRRAHRQEDQDRPRRSVRQAGPGASTRSSTPPASRSWTGAARVGLFGSSLEKLGVAGLGAAAAIGAVAFALNQAGKAMVHRRDREHRQAPARHHRRPAGVPLRHPRRRRRGEGRRRGPGPSPKPSARPRPACRRRCAPSRSCSAAPSPRRTSSAWATPSRRSTRSTPPSARSARRGRRTPSSRSSASAASSS